jgi:hypothetical protein
MRQFRGFILLFVLAIATSQVAAQSTMSERPATEQPGFYVGAYTLAPGNFVMENAFSYTDDNGRSDTRVLTFPSTLFRYGVTQGFEVRVKGEVFNQTSFSRTAIGTTVSSEFFMRQWSIGAKTTLVPAGKKFPELALVTFLQIPRTGVLDFQPESVAPSLLLASNFPVFDFFNGNVNLGIAWDGFQPVQNFQYAFALEKTVVPHLTAFVEAYGFIYGSGGPVLDHRYDAGLVWGVSPFVQFDFSGGYGWRPEDEYRTWFFAGGVSFRAIAKRNRE